MKNLRNRFFKNLRYLCLIGVIAIGLITIVGSNGGEEAGNGGNGGTTDSTPPSVPASLTATAVSSSQIDLSWTASTDDVGVTGYKIYRDETETGTSATTSYSDTSLNASTQYCYTVSAYDAADNESGQSTEACATTSGAGVGSKFPIATTTNYEQAVSAPFDGTNFLVGIDSYGDPGRWITSQLVSQSGGLVSSLNVASEGGVPIIAFDGTNYLMGYNGSERDWWGQFISPSGTVVDSPFQISTIQQHGGIAFGGGNYLVTYYREVDPSTSDSKVYGCIVSPDGIVGSEITISTGFGDFSYLNVAFDGSNFLVVWTDDDNDYEVKGRFVSSTGVLGTELSINASTDPSDNPLSVAFNGTNYLVVWCDEVGGSGSGEWDLFGQLVDTSGNLVGGVISVNTATGKQFLPLIASGGSNYLVVWADMSNDANKDGVCDSGEGTCWDVYGQYISTSGSLVGSEFAINSDAGNQFGAVSYGGGKYLVLVNNIDTIEGSVGDVYGVFITP